MKTALYMATVARVYRRAIDLAYDDILNGTSLYPAFVNEAEYELSLCTHRQYGTGFFFGKPDIKHSSDDPGYSRGAVYLGKVLSQPDEKSITIEQYNKFECGDEIEILKPDGTNLRAAVASIRDEKTGLFQNSAPHPRQRLVVGLSVSGIGVTVDRSLTGCVIRMVTPP